jgi:Rieske Fe-S protein
MSQQGKLNRRGFVKLCASALAMITASPGVLARKTGTLQQYQRVKLVDKWDHPVTVAHLKVGENYLFHYPYVSTPCFLLNLGKPTAQQTVLETKDGKPYVWQGGVGPQRSVVAFSAICAHKMTHPTQEVNFINYRHKTVKFLNKDKELSARSNIIYCCSERSVYDPTQGARVLGGPAPQPLAAILLEYNEQTDTLEAVGTYGGDMFDEYFEIFAFRLRLEYRTSDVEAKLVHTTTVLPLAEYCRNQVLC